MQKAMVEINGVQTLVISHGRWIEEGVAPIGKKDVIVVIPGNPGVPTFYEGFIKHLKAKLPSETPVWVVGHAGHVQPLRDLAFCSNGKLDKKLINLDGQVKHKVEFINKYVPKDARLHLIGHSIGSWMILNMMKDELIAKRVTKSYLLFPTVERMAESPNGRLLCNVVLRLAPVLVLLSWIFSFFPVFLQTILVQAFGLIYGIPNRSVPAVLQMLHPSSLKNIFYLAREEMNIVKDLDHGTVSKNIDKLWFYYSPRDKWTPVRYYEELIAKHPNVKAELCKRGFQHSFVLKDDKEVGYMVGDLIDQTNS